MTSDIPPKSLKYNRSNNEDSSEAKRWLIIGAHQAGASEKRVARISGLSKTAVRHIILNYQRTGNPCLPKREPKKGKAEQHWRFAICVRLTFLLSKGTTFG
jgi:transposase